MRERLLLDIMFDSPPLSAAKCLESGTILARRMAEGKEQTVYQCKNGLIDMAVPVIIRECLSRNEDFRSSSRHAKNFTTGI